jgi:type II secretory pathway component PulF
MKYAYEAIGSGGAPTSGVVEAGSEIDAHEALRRKGIYATSINAERNAEISPNPGGGGGSSKELSHFLRQLAVLVSTGTTLVESICALERQTPDGPWRETVIDLRRRIEEGAQFSEAMSHHPRRFDAVCRSLIAAGESGGKLPEMLQRLAMLVRQQQKTRSTIVGALVYPGLLMVVSAGVVGGMLFFVLPRFEGLFKSLGAPVPASTQILLDLAVILKTQWYWIIGGLAAIVFFSRAWLKSPVGRRAFDKTLVTMPGLGGVFRNFATARMARVLGVLVEGKVVLLDSIRLARESSGNICFAEMLEKAGDHVSKGESMSAVMASSGLVPGMVCEAVRSGERTGRIGPVLTSIADAMDEDNEVIVRTVMGIVEPIILIGLGVVIACLSASMFLPLFDLTSATGPAGGAK